MTVELGLLISSGVLVAGAAATWGALRQQVKALERQSEKDRATYDEAFRELRASAERQGKRMQRIEEKAAVDRAVRRATGAIPTSRDDETDEPE